MSKVVLAGVVRLDGLHCIQMAYDYIAHAQRIEARLDVAGNKQVAKQLRDAWRAGSTSGEILMALRHTLRQLLATSSLPDSIKVDAEQLIAQINQSGV